MVILCCFISLRYKFEFDLPGYKVQNYTAIVAFFVYILIPIVVFIGATRYFKHVDSEYVKDKYGTFYEGLATKNGKKVLIQPIYFLLRRLYLNFLVMFGSTVFVYQMAQIMLSTAIAGFLPYMIHSYGGFGERRINMINEILTLFSCYCFITFNIVTLETNFTLGYFVIFILGGYMAIVVLTVVYSTLRDICRKLRICCVMRAYRKDRKLR